MEQITLGEAQRRLAELLDKGAQGEDIEIQGEGVTYSVTVTARRRGSARRVPGLHPGSSVMRKDFDEPLPDAFWLGEA